MIYINFIISASTDIGIKKETNQDSYTVKKIKTGFGNIVFAVLCDGMGGLSNGEIASASVIKAFEKWLTSEFTDICKNSKEIDFSLISQQWDRIVQNMNNKIQQYGNERGISLGTTINALLITETQYIILNVGDSRTYYISDNIYQITNDHTLVAQEIAQGKITAEEAETDPRRSVLLQCCGASKTVNPEFHYGQTMAGTSFLLCSDGFRHKITAEEIFSAAYPDNIPDQDAMKRNVDYLIELNKQRGETDNISAVLIKTVQE